MTKLSDFRNNTMRESKNSINEDEITKTFDKYKDMSQKDLQQELFKEVSRQKVNGTFNYNQLSSMVENLRSSLTAEQYQNIKRILDNLK